MCLISSDDRVVRGIFLLFPYNLSVPISFDALYRMEREGWIEAEWGVSELGRKARFYKLTPKGRRQLAAETRRFAEFVEAVSPILLPG